MASIEKRGKSYRITVSKGYDIYGKKLYEKTSFTPDPSLSPKRQEKAVQDFANAFEAKVVNGMVMDAHKTTLIEFVDRWKEEYAKRTLEPGTLERYGDEFARILPKLGHLKLSELKPHVLNSFLNSLTKDGCRIDKKPGGYSKNTIAKTKAVLSSVLSTAVDWEILEKNPLENVRFDAEPAADRIKFFTPEEVVTFLKYIEEPYEVVTKAHKRIDDTGKEYKVGEFVSHKNMKEQIKIAILVSVYTGLRKSELVALQWSDIDFESDTISISKATRVVENQEIIKKPKTRNSHRKVSIPHSLTIRLQALQEEREEYKKKLLDYWVGGDWVFIQHNGKRMSYYTPYNAFHDAIIRYNNTHTDQLPVIPLHGLRHTSATLLISNNQDVRTVSNRLGHSKTSTTMDIYAHALESSEKKSSELLESIINKK